MLDTRDRLELPGGLRVEDGMLVDETRGLRIAVNSAAAIVLDRPGRRLGEIAEEFAAAFGLDRARATDDVLAFAWELNRRGLANVRRAGGRLAASLAWLVLALRLLPSGSLPPSLVRRVELDTRTYRACVLDVLAATAPRAGAVAALGMLAVLQPAALFGRTPFLAAAAVGAGLGAGIVAHEAWHAIALVRASPGAVIVSWRRLSVVHPPLTRRRRQVAALLGPLGVALWGLLLTLAGARAGLPELGLGGLPLAGHAVGLTALSSDGRNACGTGRH